MTNEERDAALIIGGKALACAREGDWREAGRFLGELQENYPEGGGIQLFLIALADTLLGVQGERPDPDALVMPMWIDANDGDVGLADDVPAPCRWAGRFIAARAADDEATCEALYNSVTSDEEFTENVCAMVEMVALTLNFAAGVTK